MFARKTDAGKRAQTIAINNMLATGPYNYLYEQGSQDLIHRVNTDATDMEIDMDLLYNFIKSGSIYDLPKVGIGIANIYTDFLNNAIALTKAAEITY